MSNNKRTGGSAYCVDLKQVVFMGKGFDTVEAKYVITFIFASGTPQNVHIDNAPDRDRQYDELKLIWEAR